MAEDTETTQRSAELMRLALPLMSKHSDGFQPMSYALWYEYVAGGNDALRQELDESIRKGGRLSSTVTFDLYNRHLIDRTESAVNKARNGLLDVLEKVQVSMAGANSNANEFNGQLAEFGRSLNEPISPEALIRHVGAMAEKSQKMGESISQLQAEFSDSQDEVKRLSEELNRMRQEVQTDPLTTLLNRRGFDLAVSAMTAQSSKDKTEVTLLMVDIDHFKKVNDTYGHLFGDQVIRGVAQAIKALVKGQDSAARYGGEEFAVLLPNTGLKGGEAVGNQIRALVERSKIRRFNSTEAVGNITISVGVACYVPGEDIGAFIERADGALYRSKQGGRNRVTVAGS
jgi:diguanylate cyclase